MRGLRDDTTDGFSGETPMMTGRDAHQARARSGLSRRSALTALAGAMAAAPTLSVASRKAVAAPLAELTLAGPPAGPSITLAHAVAYGGFSEIADSASLRTWRNPDELRAGLTSGTLSVLIMPIPVAVNLHNRGLGLRLLTVTTNGVLHVVSSDPALTSFPALQGHRLAVPFRNDPPDILVRLLLARLGMEPGVDLELVMAGSPIEAIQLLLAGRADAAMIPEPAASAAILRGALTGQTVHRVIDVTEEWSAITGLPASLPLTGLVVTEGFAAAHADLLDPLHQVLVEATDSVNADPAQAAADAAEALQFPRPVLEMAIPHSRLIAVRGRAMQPTIEPVLAVLADAAPDLVGGGLPAADFYV